MNCTIYMHCLKISHFQFLIILNFGMGNPKYFVHASVPVHVKFKAVMAEVIDSQIPEQQKVTGVFSRSH